MLTRKIDAALAALAACRAHAPGLRDCYRPGTSERAALDKWRLCGWRWKTCPNCF